MNTRKVEIRELAVKFLRKNMAIVSRAHQDKRFKFNDPKNPVEAAYSGAPHFKLIDPATYEYETLPNVSPAQAVLALMASGRLLMTCQSVQSLAIYATILDVLIHCKGQETGCQIFDKVFPQIYLRDADIYAGASITYQSFSCIGANKTARLHPLLYFLMAADNSFLNITRPKGQHLIEPGMMTYFDNHPLHQICAEYDSTRSRRMAVVCTNKDGDKPFYTGYGTNGEVDETQILRKLLKSIYDGFKAMPDNIFKQNLQLTCNDIPGFNTHFLRHINYDALTRLVMQPDKEIVAMQEWINYEKEMVALIRATQKRFDEQSGTAYEKKAQLFAKLENFEALLEQLQKDGRNEKLPLAIRLLLERIIVMYIGLNFRGQAGDDDFEMFAELHKCIALVYLDAKLYGPAIRHLELGLNNAYVAHMKLASSEKFIEITALLAEFRKDYYGIELPATDRVTNPRQCAAPSKHSPKT